MHYPGILVLTLSCAVAAWAQSGSVPPGPNLVTLAMDVELDQVSAVDAQMYRVGGHDLDRIAYDKTKVNPVTHKVPIAYLAHYIGGRWMETTPTDASSIDPSPLTPAQIAAPPPHANSPDTMPIPSGMPKPPAGTKPK